jgi:surface-anchored protein
MNIALLTPRSVAAGSLSVALAASALVIASATPAIAAERTVITNGTHVDSLYPELHDGDLEVRSHLDTGSVAPDSIVHFVPDTQKNTLPSGFEDVLAPAGTDVWIATQTGGDAGPYAGWSTYGLTDQVGTKSVDFVLTDVEGPGKVAVVQSGAFGSVVPKFSLQSGQTKVTEGANAHVHANWMFTAPGAYDLDFDFTARLKDGSEKTATTTLHWSVGGATYDAGTKPPVERDQALTLAGYEEQYTVGQEGALSVTPSAGFTPGHYHWLGRPVGSDTYGELDSTSDTWTFTAGPEHDGMQVKALAHGSAGDVETTPVTLHVAPVAGGGGSDDSADVALSISTTQETWLIGQSVKMTAKTTPTSGLSDYRWFIQRKVDAAPTEVWGQKTANFSAKPELDWDGAAFSARLYDATGKQVAASEPISFSVKQVPAQGSLTASSDKAQYAPGDTAHLTGVLDATPDMEHGHPHWYVKKVGEGAYT